MIFTASAQNPYSLAYYLVRSTGFLKSLPYKRYRAKVTDISVVYLSTKCQHIVIYCSPSTHYHNNYPQLCPQTYLQVSHISSVSPQLNIRLHSPGPTPFGSLTMASNASPSSACSPPTSCQHRSSQISSVRFALSLHTPPIGIPRFCLLK